MDKREEIIQSAIHFFSKKRFQATSVQEIAEYCGISKATLYNFFESKEEILIQVIDVSIERIIHNTMNVNLDSSLSPKEKLIKKIDMQFGVIVENKNFIRMLLTTFVPQGNPKISHLTNKVNIMIMNWYKEALLEAFGSKAEPYIWDFTLLLQGTIKEYVLQAVKEDKDIDFQEAVRFVVEQVETIINHPQKLKPILTHQNMSEYEEFRGIDETYSPKEQIQNTLKDMERKVNTLSLPKHEHEDAISTIKYFQEELETPEPRRFLLKSLLSYLGEIEGCELLVKQINTMFKTTYLY